MAQFRDVTGVGSSTAEELDRIAVENAGRLTSMGYGFSCPKPTKQIPGAPEWGTRVINTRGMGNHGTIVLVGLTPRTKALLRQGKIKSLVDQGVPERVARVAASMRYGMEVEVANLATECLEAVKQRGIFRGNSHREFNQWVGQAIADQYALSFWRKCAAAEIAEKVAWTPHD